MGLSAVTYALAKKYTDNTVIGLGGLKGAPCKVKSVVKTDGRSVVTLEWKSDTGVVQTSEVYVNDGVSVWISGRDYAVNDVVIKDDQLYICNTANSDITFNDSKWDVVISGGNSDFNIIDTLAERPASLPSTDRKIYYCIEDGNFYLWDGTKWNNINAGIKIRELTKDQYEALTPAEKMDGTIYFVTDEAGGGGGGSSELTADMTVVKAVGGITVGTTYEEGTSLETILRDMLSPVLYPTLTNPSATISATGSKLLETGATFNTTMTITLNRGSINPAYGTSGYRAGASTGYSLNGGTTQVENTFNVTITPSQLTYQGIAFYAEGEQPKDSAGNDYSSPLSAGSVNTNTISYEFVDALYANTASASTMTKQALISKSAKIKQLDIVATTTVNPEQIDVPASWTLTKIEVLNTMSGKWEDATNQFTKTTTIHDDASGNPVNYNRYTCNYAGSLGARSLKIYWS